MRQVIDDLKATIIYHYDDVAVLFCVITYGYIVTTYYLLLQLIINARSRVCLSPRLFTVTKDERGESGLSQPKLGRSLKVTQDVNVNSLYNFPIQGTAADILKKSLVLLSKRLIGRGQKL